jgi:tricorn protease-like protein
MKPSRLLLSILIAFGALLQSCQDTLSGNPNVPPLTKLEGRIIFTETIDPNTDDGSRIVMMNADSTQPESIAEQALMFNEPQNGKLAYVDEVSGQITIVDMLSGNRQALDLSAFVPYDIDARGVVLSPQGDMVTVAYSSTDLGFETPTLAIVNTDGTDFRVLAYNFDYETTPAFSPDGQLLAMYVYSNDIDVKQRLLTDIIVMDIDAPSSAVRLNTFGFETSQDNFPRIDWSPDGQHVLYHTLDSIFISSQTSATPRFLAFGSGGSFSPDGKQIAYVKGLFSSGRNTDIYVIDITGANNRRLTQSDMILEILPEWSPKGDWILVTSYDMFNAPYYASLKAFNVNDPTVTRTYGQLVWRGFWLPDANM